MPQTSRRAWPIEGRKMSKECKTLLHLACITTFTIAMSRGTRSRLLTLAMRTARALHGQRSSRKLYARTHQHTALRVCALYVVDELTSYCSLCCVGARIFSSSLPPKPHPGSCVVPAGCQTDKTVDLRCRLSCPSFSFKCSVVHTTASHHVAGQYLYV